MVKKMIKIQCSYCEEDIPPDRYTVVRYKIGIMKGYCSAECKNRAGILRMAYHRKKYLDLDVKKQSLISLLKGKYKKRPNYISK